MREKVNSYKKFKEKLKKIFKNCFYYAKHAFFATEVSRQEVTNITCQNTLSQKFWKISNCFLQLEVSLSRESRAKPWNLCVSLATGLSTREQVAKIYPQARDCGMRLDWPATESPKQGNTVFWNFQFSREQNTFQKQLIHSKIFLYLLQ